MISIVESLYQREKTAKTKKNGLVAKWGCGLIPPFQCSPRPKSRFSLAGLAKEFRLGVGPNSGQSKWFKVCDYVKDVACVKELDLPPTQQQCLKLWYKNLFF